MRSTRRSDPRQSGRRAGDREPEQKPPRDAVQTAAMPRFWFDVCRDDCEWSEDDDGTELASPEEAGPKRSATYAIALGNSPARYISIGVRIDHPEPLLTVPVRPRC